MLKKVVKTISISILFSTFLFGKMSIFISNNQKLTKVGRKEVANLFLRKTDNIRGIKLIPIDNRNKKIFNLFYKKVVKKTPSQLHSYWVKQIFKGNKQPPKKRSSKEIKRLMSKNSKYISYSTHPTTGHIILTFP